MSYYAWLSFFHRMCLSKWTQDVLVVVISKNGWVRIEHAKTHNVSQTNRCQPTFHGSCWWFTNGGSLIRSRDDQQQKNSGIISNHQCSSTRQHANYNYKHSLTLKRHGKFLLGHSVFFCHIFVQKGKSRNPKTKKAFKKVWYSMQTMNSVAKLAPVVELMRRFSWFKK